MRISSFLVVALAAYLGAGAVVGRGDGEENKSADLCDAEKPTQTTTKPTKVEEAKPKKTKAKESKSKEKSDEDDEKPTKTKSSTAASATATGRANDCPDEFAKFCFDLRPEKSLWYQACVDGIWTCVLTGALTGEEGSSVASEVECEGREGDRCAIPAKFWRGDA